MDMFYCYCKRPAVKATCKQEPHKDEELWCCETSKCSFFYWDKTLAAPTTPIQKQLDANLSFQARQRARSQK